MSQYLVSKEFVEEHREMYRWFRSQLPSAPLKGLGGRVNKSLGVVPFVLTEELDGSRMFAKGYRLNVSNSSDAAQIVSVGQTADDGTFTLSNGTDTSDIAHDASRTAMQSEMDAIWGANNAEVLIGGGTWLIRFTGNKRGQLVDLMTADSGKLAGSQNVSVQHTPFNGEVQEINLFEFFPNYRGETLPVGTVGWANHFPGVGYGIIRHNQERPAVIMFGKADSNITAGSTGTVSLYRTTQDTGANISVTNITDQQIDSGNDALIVELIDADGADYYGALPLECPA